MTGRAITANRLGDGSVVYLTRDGGWSGHIGDSLVSGAPDETGADQTGADQTGRMKAAGERAERSQQVIGACFIDVAVEGGLIRPVRLREAIRAGGPTVGRAVSQAGNGNGNRVSVR